MTERPEERDEMIVDEPDQADVHGANVPVATGSTTSYTTGTLEPGDVVPAIDKPEGEGPTPGEGPIEDPIQADDAEEFREARQNRDQ